MVTMKVSETVSDPEVAVTVIVAVPYCSVWKSRVSVLPATLVAIRLVFEF